MITIQDHLNASHWEHVTLKNKDNTPLRVRRSGKNKLWKTRPHDFRIPVKYGLYESSYITQDNKDQWLPK